MNDMSRRLSLCNAVADTSGSFQLVGAQSTEKSNCMNIASKTDCIAREKCIQMLQMLQCRYPFILWIAPRLDFLAGQVGVLC